MSEVCFYQNDSIISYKKLHYDIVTTREQVKRTQCNNVMLFHTDSYQFSVLFFALILENKHILLPPNQQQGTLDNLAKFCDATAGEISLFDKDKIEINVLDNNTINNQASERDFRLQELKGKITFFTSGSTGQPKAISKQFQQLTKELETLKSEFFSLLSQVNIFVSTVSHQHIYGLLFKILLPLSLKKTIISTTFEYPEHINTELAKLAYQEQSTLPQKILLISSPAHLKRLVIDNVLTDNSSNFIGTISSGGLLARNVSRMYKQQMDKSPIEVYGSTETGGIAWRDHQNEIETPWQVFSGIRYTVNKTNNLLEIESPLIKDKHYLTDDIVQAVSDKTFLLKGRADRTVKLEEKRINLDHIETHLLKHQDVLDVKIFVKETKKQFTQRTILCAVVVLNKDTHESVKTHGKLEINKQLNGFLLKEFERICLPKKWRYLTKFPYNSQGKLVLSELESLFD